MNVTSANNVTTTEHVLKFNETCNFSEQNLGTQYINSLYWAVATLTTVGFGDISATVSNTDPSRDNNAEILYSILILILGTLVYTYVIANLEEIVASIDVTSMLYQMKVERIKLYAQMRRLPPALADKLVDHTDALWRHQKGADEKDILNMVPRGIRKAILYEMNSQLLKKIPSLGKAKGLFLPNLAEGLLPGLATTGNVLFEAEQCCNQLILLIEGEIELVSADSKTAYAKKSGPCLVGLAEFMLREMRPCNARCLSVCKYYALPMEHMTNCLRDSPDIRTAYHTYLRTNREKIVKTSIVKRMQTNMANTKLAKMMLEESEKQKSNDGPWIVQPDSMFRRTWDVLALIGVVYIVTSVWYRLGFGETGETSVAFVIVDQVVDLFFWADIVMHLRHFAVVEDGIVMEDRAKIWKVYSSTFFAPDVFATLPLELVVFLAFPASSPKAAASIAIAVCRVPSLSRFFKVVDLLENMYHFLEKLGFKIKDQLWRLSLMFFAVVLVCHIIACIFFGSAYWTYLAVGGSANFQSRGSWTNSMGHYINVDPSDSSYYVASSTAHGNHSSSANVTSSNSTSSGNSSTPTSPTVTPVLPPTYLMAMYWALYTGGF